MTGAARGIGLAVSRALTARGASVLLADVDLDAARRAADSLGPARALAARADVSDIDDIDAVVGLCVAELGAIDILVNNAAVTRFVDVMGITPEDWDAMHSVNARGTFFTMQRAAREMIEAGRGGRIVNIASIAGKGYAGTSNAAYAATKGAVIAMTAIAARQLAPHGINVNAVCPGLTHPPRRRPGRAGGPAAGRFRRALPRRARGHHSNRPRVRAGRDSRDGRLPRRSRSRGDHRPVRQRRRRADEPLTPLGVGSAAGGSP